jgi:hypothetical protein
MLRSHSTSVRRTYDKVAKTVGEGLVEHRHHAKTQKVDFDDARIGAIFLVPLHDDAAGINAGSKRNHAVESTLADHDAARMLSQVAQQVLKRHCWCWSKDKPPNAKHRGPFLKPDDRRRELAETSRVDLFRARNEQIGIAVEYASLIVQKAAEGPRRNDQSFSTDLALVPSLAALPLLL